MEVEALSHEHMLSSGTGLVTALINRAPYSSMGRQRSGAHDLEHQLHLPCNFEAGVEMGITKIVAVYHTCPVMLVGETAEGALLELSLPAVADVHEVLPLRLWQASWSSITSLRSRDRRHGLTAITVRPTAKASWTDLFPADVSALSPLPIP